MDRICDVLNSRQDLGSTRSSCRIASLSLLFSLMFCSAGQVLAGNNVWTSNGPEETIVRALGIDSSNRQIVYAGTERNTIIIIEEAEAAVEPATLDPLAGEGGGRGGL